MRNGHLLAEDSPQNLLDEFECAKLEDVFFKLCQLDSHDENGSVLTTSSSIRSSNVSEDTENVSESGTVSTVETETSVENNTVALENEKNANQTKSAVPSPVTPVFNTSAEHLIDSPASKDKKEIVKEEKEQPKATKKWGQKEEGFGVEKYGSNCVNDMARVFDRMSALLLKNFLCMWRNIG